MMVERGLAVDHSTIGRWGRIRRQIRSPNGPGGSMNVHSCRLDVSLPAGRLDGATVDFMLSPKRDLIAAKHFLQIALWRTGQIRPRVLNVDGRPSYPPVIAELKQTGELSRQCQCRPCPYLNNVLEQDHRFVKKRIAASFWFRSVDGALRTIAGYEEMNMIRKGQVRWPAKGDIVGQIRFVERVFGLAG